MSTSAIVRLDPCVFPSETNVRFRLLLVAAVMFAAYNGYTLRLLIFPDAYRDFERPLVVPDSEVADEQYLREARQVHQQSATTAAITLVLPAGLTLICFAVAYAIYRDHPRRVRRGRTLTSLEACEDDAFRLRVTELVEAFGVTPRPQVEITAGLQGHGGQACGFPGRYAMILQGGLRTLLRKSPRMMNAVVLHELAHFANGDVTRYFFTNAVWTAVCVSAALPVAVAILLTFAGSLVQRVEPLDLHRLMWVAIPSLVMELGKLGGLLLVVSLVRASVLRVRESYADWRVAVWGAGDALRDAFRGHIDRAAPQNRWAMCFGWFRLHPQASERLAVLTNPAPLFRTTSELPFTVGILAAIFLVGSLVLVLPAALTVGSGMISVGAWLAESARESGIQVLVMLAIVIDLVAGCVIVILVVTPVLLLAYHLAGTIITQLQRATIYELACLNVQVLPDDTPRSGTRLLPTAVLLALGLELGTWLLPLGGLRVNSLTQLPWLLLWLAGVAFVNWLCLAYTYCTTRLWLGGHAGPTAPQGKRRLISIVALLLFALFYFPIVLTRIMILSPFDASSAATIQSFVAGLFVLATMIYALVFAASWLVATAAHAVIPARCPKCQVHCRTTSVIAATCPACGEELASWAFIQSSEMMPASCEAAT